MAVGQVALKSGQKRGDHVLMSSLKLLLACTRTSSTAMHSHGFSAPCSWTAHTRMVLSEAPVTSRPLPDGTWGAAAAHGSIMVLEAAI